MKEKLKLFSSIISYICAVIILIIYLFVLFNSHYSLSTTQALIYPIISCIFSYIGSLALSKYLKNNKPLKLNLTYSFILYLILLST